MHTRPTARLREVLVASAARDRLAAAGTRLAGLDPARPAGGLDDQELKSLHKAIRATLRNLTKRGGSHTGALQPARHRDGLCPIDGAPLLRRTVGGRTTYSCPVHQQ